MTLGRKVIKVIPKVFYPSPDGGLSHQDFVRTPQLSWCLLLKLTLETGRVAYHVLLKLLLGYMYLAASLINKSARLFLDF